MFPLRVRPTEEIERRTKTSDQRVFNCPSVIGNGGKSVSEMGFHPVREATLVLVTKTIVLRIA